MSKIVKSKFRRSRSLGVSLYGDEKDSFNFKNYKPGQHGQTVHRTMSTYAVQLNEKQKLRFVYDIGEKQFRKIFVEASRRKGDVGDNLVGMLESRLDSVVYRANFATSFYKAKQMVSHGHVTVNGKKVNIRSYILKEDDVVSVLDKVKSMDYFKLATEKSERRIPDYLQLLNKYEIKIVRKPVVSEVPYAFVLDPQLVIEWYSNKIG